MLQTATPTPRVVLFLKAKIAHQAGFAKYGNPPRWHKISHDAPAPKGAPIAAHPHAGGQHAPAQHFTPEQWGQLKLPPENQNAGSYNKLLDKIKDHSDEGDVTAILGMQFGTNTYGKKAAAIANTLLEMHGSPHKVAPGQGAGWHAAVEHHVAEPAPQPVAAAPEAPPAADTTPAPVAAEVKAEPGVQIGAVPVPEFTAKMAGVITYYQGVVSKILAFAQAGDAAGLAAMVNPELNSWKGKTPNSKALLAYHAGVTAAMQKVTPAAAAAEPATPAQASMEKVEAKSLAQKLEGMSLNEKQLVVDKAMGKLFTDEQINLWTGMTEAQKEVSFEAVGALQELHGSMKASGLSATKGKHAALWGALPFPLQGQMVQGASTFIPAGTAPAAPAAGVVHMDGHNYKQDANAEHGWLFEVGEGGGWYDVLNPDVAKKLNAEHGPKEGDTKDGLVFKDGRWHKVVAADEHGEVPPAVVPLGDGTGIDAEFDEKEKAWVLKLAEKGKWDTIEHLLSNDTSGFNQSKAGQWIQGVLANKPKATTVGAPSVDPVAESKPPAHALLDQIPWDKLQLPDSNTNAKSINPKLAKLKAAAYAGDVAGLEAMKFGLNTYNKKLAAVQATALAALAEAPAAAPAMGPAEPMAAGTSVNDTPPAAAGLSPSMKQAVESFDAEGLQALLETPLVKPEIVAYAKELLAGMSTPKPEPLAQVVTEMLDGMAAAGEWEQLAEDMESAKNPEKKKYIARLLKQKPAPAAAVSMPPDDAYPDLGDAYKNGVKKMVEAGQIDTLQSWLNTINEGKPAHAFLKEVIAKNKGAASAQAPAAAPAAAADDGPKEGDTKMGVGGMLVFHNGHWVLQHGKLKPAEAVSLGKLFKTAPGNKAKLKKMAVEGDAAGLQAFIDKAHKQPMSKAYAQALLKMMAEKGGVPATASAPAPKAAAPAPAAAPTFTPPGGVVDLDGAEPMDSWKQVGPQGGSNPGGAFVDEEGVKWYCKFPPNEDHAKSEVLASKLYELAGVAAQDAKLVTKGGKIGIASKWEDVKADPEKLHSAAGAQSGFAVDAWLANYDVVGPDFKNMQIGADGEAFRVDAGGSLAFRAQGKKKTDFGNTVKEFTTLRDPNINAATAKVFGSMTEADITASAAKVLSISDDAIIDMVMEHGPGDDLEKAALAEKLIARKNDIAKKYPKAMPKVVKKEKPDPTKLKVKAEDIPNPPDFVGLKVSSKAHVNEFNAKATKAVHDFALKGNLVGLKDYHFEAVDKETGAPLGLKPIEQHPSNQVKTYWSELVSALSFIANPPEQIKFTTKIGGTVAKVSKLFKGAKYGVTTASAAASSRLAFWIALGATKPALSLLPKGASTEFQSDPQGVPKITPALSAKAKSDYQALKPGGLVRAFINGIQSSGTYNDNFRDGKMVTSNGHDARQMVLAVHEYAQEKPEGFELYKWIQLSPAMLQQLHGCPEGTVFQNPGSMCCSTGANATSGFGTHRMRIRYAAGAKAVDSFGSGNYQGEKEITTLPGQRFVILSCKKVKCPIKGERTELDVLMLPPDPSYLAEIEASLKGVK